MRSLQAPRRASALIGVLAALSLLGGASGCSFLFAHGPPPNHQSLASFDCTSMRAGPAIDLVLVAASVPATIWAATDDPDASARAAVASAVVGGAALASTVYGFVVTQHCIEAEAALQARARPPAPFALAQPSAPGQPSDPWLSAGPPPLPIPGLVPRPAPDGAAP